MRRSCQRLAALLGAFLVSATLPLALIQAQSQELQGPVPVRQSDVIYGRKNGLALTMEVLKAPEPNGLGVIWIVSSSGVSSRENTLRAGFQKRIAPFLAEGYSVFAAIHSSAPRYSLQEYVEDASRAVRFIRHNAQKFGIDPDRVAIAGSSAGGNIALLTALLLGGGDPESDDPVERVSSRVQATGSFFAPTDFLNFERAGEDILDFMLRKYGSVSPTFRFFKVNKDTGVQEFLEDRNDVREMLRKYSPVSHVTADDPPTILIHGDADPVVPVQQSRRLSERLEAARVPVKLVVREEKKHAWPGWESDGALVADWFNQHLR